MVLQIPSDTGKGRLHGDAEPAEFGGVTHTGQHQTAWRIDRPKRHDDFDAGAGLDLSTVNKVLDRDAAAAFEAEPGDQGIGQYGQIVIVQHWPQIGLSRVEALAVADIEIGRCCAFVAGAVRIVDSWNAEFGRAFDQRCRYRMKHAASLDPARPTRPPPLPPPPFPALS